MGALARATAKELLELIISTKINIALCAIAVLCLMCYMASGNFVRESVTWTVAWVLHFALMSAMDIKKGGRR